MKLDNVEGGILRRRFFLLGLSYLMSDLDISFMDSFIEFVKF